MSFTTLSWNRLLEWLDDGVDSYGQSYLDIRRRLVAYFNRRERPFADELADETLTRVARTLEQEGRIVMTPPARYCFTVARFVLLEDARHKRRLVRFNESRARRCMLAKTAADDQQQQRLDRLDGLLGTLPPDHRHLIVEYYRGSGRCKIERRRALAGCLGISMNALAIRAHRIRALLSVSVASAGR